MTNYTDACETLRQYPQSLIAAKSPEQDSSQPDHTQLKKAAEAYKDHLATHSEIKNYVQDSPILAEALAGCFLKELTPLYRQSAPEPGSEDFIRLNSAITTLENIVCALLECIAELCVDRTEACDDDEISAECLTRRQIVKKTLAASLVSQIAEAMIRRGVSAKSESTRLRSVEYCAILTRRLGSLDVEYWLKTARLACECVEAPTVRRNGVIALGVISKAKLKLGNKTSALPITHELTLCVSALMDVLVSEDIASASTSVDGNSTSATLARFDVSVILQLLQDPERQTPISWTTWLGQLLDDRFTPQADEDNLHGGLCFLNLLYSGATEEFVAYTTAAVLPLRVLPMVMKSEHRPIRIRAEACIFLMNCTDWPTLREMLMKADCIDLLSPMVLDEARVDDPELQSSVLAVLAKLMLHGAEVRELLADTIPFLDLLLKLFSSITDSQTHRDARISGNLVIVLSALSFHQEFKAYVLGVTLDTIKSAEAEYEAFIQTQPSDGQLTIEGGDGGTPDHPLVKPGSVLDGLITKLLDISGRGDSHQLFNVIRKLSCLSGDGQASFHIVLTLFNLVRSSRDRQLLRKTKGGPDFDDHQLKELEMMYEKLPENAKVKERLQYTSGGLIPSSAVRKLVLLDKTLMPLIINCGSKLAKGSRTSLSKSLIGMSAQTVRYLASLIELRPLLVSQGGLSVLSKALELDPEDKHSRFALVSIVATVRPESHRYETRMSCAHQALRMIDIASEELYVHLAARSLVNLTSSFEDVSLKVFDAGNGWRRLETVLTDWSDATSAFGAEIMCNIVAKDEINLKIAELIHQNKMPWTITLLFAYAGDNSCKPRQLACLATISYLTRIQPTARWLIDGCQLSFQSGEVNAAEKLLELWLCAAGTPDDYDAQARLSVSILNILFFALDSKVTDSVQVICQKFVLSIGMVWNQIDDRCRTLIENTVKTSEMEPDIKELVRSLAMKAPSQQIQDVWAKLLNH